mmetsp:Transcript_302/g.346  ORF Transcript_302/g.346 Transcript_302/m.346 type:complete len:517 (-) Transcript_302:3-1553(-)
MEVNPSALRDKLLHQCRDTIDSLQADLDRERLIRDQLREQFTRLKETHSAVLEELYTSRAKAESWAEDLKEVQSLYEDLQRQEIELRTKNFQLTSLNENLNKQLNELSNSQARLREALGSAEKEGSSVKEMLEQYESKLKMLTIENESLKTTLNEMNERLRTVDQLSERENQEMKFKYDCKVRVLTQELEEKFKLQTKIESEKQRSSFDNKLNAAKKEISDFYEEQLEHMRKRLDSLSTQLEARHLKTVEMEETLTRTRESETYRSLNWEEKSSRYVRKAEKLQTSLDEMGEKYEILLDKHNEIKTEHHRFKTKCKSLEGEKTKLLSDLECLKAEAEAVIQERNRAAQSVNDLERTIHSLRSEIEQVVRADAGKQERISELEEERDTLLMWKQHTSQRISELEQKSLEAGAEIKTLHFRLNSREYKAEYTANIEEYIEIIDQLNEDRARLAKAIEQLESNFKTISVKFNRERSSKESLTKDLNDCMMALNQERVMRQQAERELYRVSASPVSSTLA